MLKKTLFSFLVLLLSLTNSFATDYQPDAGYPDLGFESQDVVYDVFVHPDGRYVVAGEDFNGINPSVPFLKRYNSNGTLDSTFTSPLSSAGGSNQNFVTRIMKILPNGQYVVRGRFVVASTLAYWARLNSDGSFDNSIPLTTLGSDLSGVQDDGKLLYCGPRTENGVTYNTLFRRNADLSFDPGFRVTFADPGTCPEAYPLPSGKILVAGQFFTSGQAVQQLQRLNADGTVDGSFAAAVATGSLVRVLSVLPDGKILIGNSSTMRLLNPEGSQAMAAPNCRATFGIPLADGSFMVNGCRKWTAGTRDFQFIRVMPDGTVDQSMDWISLTGFEGPKGFRSDGNGGFYFYGGISQVSGFNRRGFVRLAPNNTPKKARFDFDGDGKSDIAVFRPSDGVWYINQSTAGIKYRQWGFPTDRVAAADADVDQKTDIGIFRDGAWHFLSANDVHMYMCLGTAGDQPLIGFSDEPFIKRDFMAARRPQTAATQWFIRSGYLSCWFINQQPLPQTVVGEQATDKAVVGDFNGDSVDEIGYFRNGLWYGADSGGVAAPVTINWGLAGDIPVPADYDGDRQTDFAVFRPSTGDWWVRGSTVGIFVVRFGQNGDIPVPADYDGDGKADIAIYRAGSWWQFLSATNSIAVAQWGLSSDIPIPAQMQ